MIAALQAASHDWCVVMSDNRRPEGVGYWALAAQINARYASQHGYGFVYVVFPEGCSHRHPAWCKLLALERTMSRGIAGRRCASLLYVDSDCYLGNRSIESTLEHASAADRDDGGKPAWQVLILDGRPLYQTVITALIFVRNTQRACGVLRTYWESHPLLSPYHWLHPWEQFAINSLASARAHGSEVRIQPVTLFRELEVTHPAAHEAGTKANATASMLKVIARTHPGVSASTWANDGRIAPLRVDLVPGSESSGFGSSCRQLPFVGMTWHSILCSSMGRADRWRVNKSLARHRNVLNPAHLRMDWSTFCHASESVLFPSKKPRLAQKLRLGQ
jgi:hypothetical protein